MVFGPVLDALAARKRGVSPVQVLSEGNRLVALRLPFLAKVVFWLTNMPYWWLSVELALGSRKLSTAVGSRAYHTAAMCIIAAASTAFHGSVLFGAVGSPWPARLLGADILCANAYGALLAVLCGVPVALRNFGPGILLLFVAARSKRAGRIKFYAAAHGSWHVLSCIAIGRCLHDV